ncbi:MAG: DUF1289 domain-containing protein [Pseudomonadota bacterium]
MVMNSRAPERAISVESPCISVCTVDDAGVCLGCGRTLDEIANWLNLSPEERAKIMIRIADNPD